MADIRERNKFAIRRSDLDDALNDIRDLGYTLHFRNDENIAYMFNRPAKHPDDVTDRESFYRLVHTGNAALSRKDFVELRRIIGELLNLSGHAQDELLSTELLKA